MCIIVRMMNRKSSFTYRTDDISYDRRKLKPTPLSSNNTASLSRLLLWCFKSLISKKKKIKYFHFVQMNRKSSFTYHTDAISYDPRKLKATSLSSNNTASLSKLLLWSQQKNWNTYFHFVLVWICINQFV